MADKDFFNLTVVNIKVRQKPLMIQPKDKLLFNMEKESKIGMMGLLMKVIGMKENNMVMVLDIWSEMNRIIFKIYIMKDNGNMV